MLSNLNLDKIVLDSNTSNEFLTSIIRNYDLNSFDVVEPEYGISDIRLGAFYVFVEEVDKQHFIERKKKDPEHFSDALYANFLCFYFEINYAAWKGDEKKAKIETIYNEMQHILEPIEDIKKFVLDNKIFDFLSSFLVKCSTVLFSLLPAADTKCFAAYTRCFDVGFEKRLMIEECYQLVEDFSTLTEDEYDDIIDGFFCQVDIIEDVIKKGADPRLFDECMSFLCFHITLEELKKLYNRGCKVDNPLNIIKKEKEMFDERIRNFLLEQK